eukprot:1134702-Rhodomonas_salina.1
MAYDATYCYAVCGIELAYGATNCYAVCGTDISATRTALVQYWTRVCCYGTELAYGATGEQREGSS